MNKKSIYDKNQAKGRSFKTLLMEDQEDLDFRRDLKNKESDKILLTRQTGGDRV